MSEPADLETLRAQWTDRFVRVNPDKPELARFAGRVGRVVTVNCNGRALVDFALGPWTDIPASPDYLLLVDPEEAKTKYDPTVNSAQAYPQRQS
jgi:hypothetical protein